MKGDREKVEIGRRLVNWVRWALVLRPLDLIARWIFGGATRCRRVLVVYPARLGDSILWCDAATRIRQLYCSAQWHITLLADPVFAPLARFQPQFDSVWEINQDKYWRKLRYRFRVNCQIAKARFQIALNPAIWPDQYFADTIISESGAVERVGWKIGAQERSWPVRVMRKWRAKQYTRLFDGANDSTTDMLSLNCEFVRLLGSSTATPARPQFVVDKRWCTLPLSRFYVLCPGASAAIRRWPLKCFAEVAKGIYASTGWTGVVCGSKEETALAEELMRQSGVPLVDLSGELDITQLAALLSRAEVVISNESGPLHLAAAVGARTISVVGGGHFGRCVPYPAGCAANAAEPSLVYQMMECFGCNWRCRFELEEDAPAPCITGVGAEQVLTAALRAIGRARESSGDQSVR